MKSIIERTLWSAALAFAGILTVALNTTSKNWTAVVFAAIGAGIAAGASILKNAVFRPTSTVPSVNIFERGLWSFVQGAVGTIPLEIHVGSLNGLKGLTWAAFAGGATALLSFAKNTSAAASATPASAAFNSEVGGPGRGWT